MWREEGKNTERKQTKVRITVKTEVGILTHKMLRKILISSVI
jgi:hypothetical protein